MRNCIKTIIGRLKPLYYAPDTGKWELGKDDFFPDIDDMLKLDITR